MAKDKDRKTSRPRRTNDRELAGVERIDASPEEIARSLFPPRPQKGKWQVK